MSQVINAFLAGQEYRNQLNQQQQQAQAMQEQRGMQNTAAKVQGALMQGDQDLARSIAAGSGSADIMGAFRDQMAAMDTQERTRQQEIFGAVGNLANSLRGVPVEQRSIALRSEAPRLMQMGVPAEEIQRYDQLLSDPASSDAVLAALSSRVTDAQAVFDAYAPQMQAENEVLAAYQGGRLTQGPINPNAPANRAIDQQRADASATQAQAAMMGAQTSAARERREAMQPQTSPNYRAVGGTLYDVSDPSGPQVVIAAPEFSATEARQYRQQAQQMDTIEGALSDYRGRLEDVGTNIIYNPRNPDIAALEAARTGLLMQVKELFNLGVLTGPDMDIIEGAIGDPTGRGAIGNSRDSLLAQLSVVEDYLNRTRSQIPAEFRGARANIQPGDDASIDDLLNQYAPE